MYYWSDEFVHNLCFDGCSSLKWLELRDETSQKRIYHADSQYTKAQHAKCQICKRNAMYVFELLLLQYAVDFFYFSLDLSKPLYSDSYGWVHQFWLVWPWTHANSWCQLCHLLQPSGWHIIFHFHDQYTCNSESCCLASRISVDCLTVLWKLAFFKSGNCRTSFKLLHQNNWQSIYCISHMQLHLELQN